MFYSSRVDFRILWVEFSIRVGPKISRVDSTTASGCQTESHIKEYFELKPIPNNRSRPLKKSWTQYFKSELLWYLRVKDKAIENDTFTLSWPVFHELSPLHESTLLFHEPTLILSQNWRRRAVENNLISSSQLLKKSWPKY